MCSCSEGGWKRGHGCELDTRCTVGAHGKGIVQSGGARIVQSGGCVVVS